MAKTDTIPPNDDLTQLPPGPAGDPALLAPAPAPDTGFLMQLRDALQGEQVAIQRKERSAILAMLDKHDQMRAALPRVKLTAVTAFTMVDDENPEGRVIQMGEEFEVSEFDLPRYLGKGLPRANSPTEASGVSITQA